MVTLAPRDECTGCAACYNACRSEAIVMVMDDEGFLSPQIKYEVCKECELCVQACPILTPPVRDTSPSPDVFASWNRDPSIRLSSSSGGIFLPLAEHTVLYGGVVFGAAFDLPGKKVVHRMAITYEECKQFSGSKYVQSDVEDCFREAKQQLRTGKKVLFSGTPCQIAGLYSYLHKDYDNLITCDFACHGVPSPGVFEEHITWLEKKNKSPIASVSFRNKAFAYNFGLIINFSSGKQYRKSAQEDEFYRGFLTNVLIRKSCYRCVFAKIPRQSDITLGDFHNLGIIANRFILTEKEGISLVLCNTVKGYREFSSITGQLEFSSRSIQDAAKYNRLYDVFYAVPQKRNQFFKTYQNVGYKKARKILLSPIKRTIKNLFSPYVIQTGKRIISLILKR